MKAERFALPVEQGVGHLDENSGPVTSLRVAAGGAPMAQVDQNFESFLDDPMGLPALDVGNHADAAAIVFLLRRIESLFSQLS